MKVSESWLREWVDPALNVNELAEQITMAGLEVDAIEPVAADFSGVIVGEIVALTQHPNADKLRVCQVIGLGEEATQVVCGASNARVGIKIPFATVGARLPGDLTIKKAKLRGVASYGMLCGQVELQLGNDDQGLWELAADAPVGVDLRDYLLLNDHCLELDLTPNRSDCLSVKGIAREVGTLNRLVVNTPDIAALPAEIEDYFPVDLQAAQACPRYVGRIIRGVDLSKPSPLWMQERLRRAGINVKDIVVDTTNYVLLELGQPLHAFDLSRLAGGIVVRHAKAGESLALLNGQTVDLDEDTLVIADHQAPVAMAGIMGGSESAVSATSEDILLESAFFVPTVIAGRARRYGLHTDSSHRFERGVDYCLQEQAIERASRLITDVAGGRLGPVSVTQVEHPLLASRTVFLRRSRILRSLGFAIPDEDVREILTRLGLVLLDDNEAGWHFEMPSYRFDLDIEADLLEELARIYGYNRLPTASLAMAMDLPASKEAQIDIEAFRAQLVARDYREVVCYSFVDAALQRQMDPQSPPVPLKNPISADMSVMRTSLLQGLVKTLQHNINRQQSRVRLFETGLRFLLDQDTETDKSPSLRQQAMVAGLVYGYRHAESWAAKQDLVDFYDIKGDVESLLALTSRQQAFSFAAAEHAAMHPGQCAAIIVSGEVVGHVGALHPILVKTLELSQPVYVFEIAQSALVDAALPVFQPLSRYPEVRRDLAIIVDQSLSVTDIEAVIKAAAGEVLTNVNVFDVYVGEGIDLHSKSIAIGLTFQALSRTLTDKEINSLLEKVIVQLKDQLNAELR
ncbi:MAG: phenylalanine--tRNA ligase subunit beta [Cellvibrionaceae bacterium]|nr:phenylalanine--tRNA ligase subunit beta [Cellvibrionaceae bacterium]